MHKLNTDFDPAVPKTLLATQSEQWLLKTVTVAQILLHSLSTQDDDPASKKVVETVMEHPDVLAASLSTACLILWGLVNNIDVTKGADVENPTTVKAH